MRSFWDKGKKVCRGCGKLRHLAPMERVTHQYCDECRPKVKRAIEEGRSCGHGRKLAECGKKECTVLLIMTS